MTCLHMPARPSCSQCLRTECSPSFGSRRSGQFGSASAMSRRRGIFLLLAGRACLGTANASTSETLAGPTLGVESESLQATWDTQVHLRNTGLFFRRTLRYSPALSSKSPILFNCCLFTSAKVLRCGGRLVRARETDSRVERRAVLSTLEARNRTQTVVQCRSLRLTV